MTKQIPLTQGKFALVDDQDFEYLMQWRWYARKTGNTFYAVRKEGFPNKCIYMHRVVSNAPKGMIVDHADRDGLNNRRSNVRVCTYSQNNANRGLDVTNKTGYKGVCWYAKRNKYLAYIKVDRIRIHLGYFVNPEDAAKAYDVAAIEHFGEFAYLNFGKKKDQRAETARDDEAILRAARAAGFPNAVMVQR